MIGDVSVHQTISDVLRHRSSQQPSQVAYRFLSDDGTASSEITYRELDERARRVAAWIARRNLANQPIPLIFSPGLDFICALFGGLYAGNPLVPLNLPSLPEGTQRVVAALADVSSPIVLVGDTVSARSRRELGKLSASGSFELIPFANVTEAGDQWREPPSDPDRLAVLQYTSGSTSSPKGVEISHRNLLHNIALMSAASNASTRSIGVSWLPHFHDMGLIGGVLMPLCVGFPVTLMSPASFLRRPLRWLEAISNTKATISGAPNFGYEHCVREIPQADLQSIDLSSWRTAYVGAEPIRAETMARFCDKFGGAGFQKQALFTCYGLAEATLMVSGQRWNDLSEQRFSRSSMKNGFVSQARDPDDCATLVSAGTVLEGHRVLIVDPRTKRTCGAGAVGEIWISSDSVGKGYRNRPLESAETFRARPIDDEERSYLKTGDLGFIWRDQLFITGRQKDLLIIRGANFHAQDIERAIEAEVPSLRAGFGAAFTIEQDREEKLVVVYELDRTVKPDSVPEFDAIVTALARGFGLKVHAIALLKRNKIPRTTSGKIKRQQCRSDFLDGVLPVMAAWHRTRELQGTGASFGLADFRGHDLANHEAAAAIFRGHLAELLGVDVDLMGDHTSIFELGIDSLVAAQLQNRVERSLKIRLDVAKMLEVGTIGAIIDELVHQMNGGTRQKAVHVIDDVFDRVLRLSDDDVAKLLSVEDGSAAWGQS